MTPQELEHRYQREKHLFHHYLDSIKKSAPSDIFTILNATLTKNPYATVFPKHFFSKQTPASHGFGRLINNTILFYGKNFYALFTYLISYLLYRIYFTKKPRSKPTTIIDVFALVDTVNHTGTFKDPYFTDLYGVFEKHSHPYTLLIRFYGAGKNPFKLIPFFKIINQDHRDFLLEFELLTIRNFLELAMMVLAYPFKTLRLWQKPQNLNDEIFNLALLSDIKAIGFESFSRYVLGKNLAKISTIEKIFSWSEFQAVERGFNFGIRKNNPKVKLIGCQFFLNYETYFNAYVDDLDFEMLSSPHKVLVNGSHYVLDRKRVEYELGVSLRYKELFHFDGIKEEKDIILLGSYIESDTKYMLENTSHFSDIMFKNHPAVNIQRLYPLPANVTLSNESIYTLFSHAKMVIGTASGTLVEAVASGVSVIIIASQNNLTANPLVEYGKGEIWEIAFSKDDIPMLYNRLLNFRQENRSRIQEIAKWYKNNFFIEPTETNICKAFELKQEAAKE